MGNSDLHKHYFLFNGHYLGMFLFKIADAFIYVELLLFVNLVPKVYLLQQRIILYDLVVHHFLSIPKHHFLCSIHINVYFHSSTDSFGINCNAGSNNNFFLATNLKQLGLPLRRLPPLFLNSHHHQFF